MSAPLDETARRGAFAAATAAAAKSDAETVVLEVGSLLSIVEYFVIASGRNARQVKAIVTEVEEQVFAAEGVKTIRSEGRDGWEWVLLDFGPFVVHVLQDETRAFYDLERLWADVPRLEWRTETSAGREV